MHTIRVRNVNEALPLGLHLLKHQGRRRDSRGGEVVVMDAPVMTVYERPWERVLLSERRDANPFFHVFESLWMLAGRNDLKPLTAYVKRMKQYSDDGRVLHGAYGHRWRKHFGADQLGSVIRGLTKNPDCRRQVISMWDPRADLNRIGKDVPCNTHCYVWVDGSGRLSMTVCCRSNDMIWGAYGANAVHFSFLQEYIACGLGRDAGRLYQLSNNFHAYVNVLEKVADLACSEAEMVDNPYRDPSWEQSCDANRLFMDGSYTRFDEDLALLLEEDVSIGLRSAWLRRVAVPLIMAHRHFESGEGDYGDRCRGAAEIVGQIAGYAPDWYQASLEWLVRREAAHNATKEAAQSA